MHFAPVQVYLISILLFVLVDVSTGIWASIKEGKSFKSKILGDGLFSKLIIYFLLMWMAIQFGLVLQSVTHTSTFYIAWILTILISAYEISSLIENVIKINPKLLFLNRFKRMITTISDKQIKQAKKKFDSEEEIKE
jgi:hypothetical protein